MAARFKWTIDQGRGLPTQSGSRQSKGMKNTLIIPAIALVLATACSDVTGSEPIDETDPCGAQDHTSLLGSNIAAVTLPADLNDRVVGPDSVVTTDYVPSRLNIETNTDGMIIGLSCG